MILRRRPQPQSSRPTLIKSTATTRELHLAYVADLLATGELWGECEVRRWVDVPNACRETYVAPRGVAG